MSTATSSPTPLPQAKDHETSTAVQSCDDEANINRVTEPSRTLLLRHLQQEQQQLCTKLPSPKFRFRIDDLRHPAATSFMTLLPDVEQALETALSNIIKSLYTSPSAFTALSRRSEITYSERKTQPSFTPVIPATRSVTLILRDFSGVAYTLGTELDDDHKEIHFSLSYIGSTAANNKDPLRELKGVLTHELVHCYQHTTPPEDEEGFATTKAITIPGPPGGLIEGIADFVRLKASLGAGHWKPPTSAKERAGKWDQGYQDTAFFLAWLEDVYIGEGAIGMLNDRLFRTGYVGEYSNLEERGAEGEKREERREEDEQKSAPRPIAGFWKGLFGETVDELWVKYGEYLDSLDVSNNNDSSMPSNVPSARNDAYEKSPGESSPRYTTWEEELIDPEHD